MLPSFSITSRTMPARWPLTYVLSIVRSISNWYATRDDDYVSPVVRGMRRSDRRSAPEIASLMTTRSVPFGRRRSERERLAPSFGLLC